jgi:hypothetical protein
MNLDRAFVDGARFECTLGSGTLSTREVADLQVTSGALLAADALISSTGIGFIKRVARGRYPVILSIARFEDEDERVAFAMLRFRPEPPRSWEVALALGQDPADLEDDEIYGYPVDSGTGCFMDLDAQRAWVRMSDTAAQELSDALLRELEQNDVPSWSWAEMLFDPAKGTNQVSFSTGLGDGVYASYWGLDADGEVVSLVTDFGLYLTVDGLLVGPPPPLDEA